MRELALLLLTVSVTAGCGSLMPNDIKFKKNTPPKESRPNDPELYDPFQIMRQLNKMTYHDISAH